MPELTTSRLGIRRKYANHASARDDAGTRSPDYEQGKLISTAPFAPRMSCVCWDVPARSIVSLQDNRRDEMKRRNERVHRVERGLEDASEEFVCEQYCRRAGDRVKGDAWQP